MSFPSARTQLSVYKDARGTSPLYSRVINPIQEYHCACEILGDAHCDGQIQEVTVKRHFCLHGRCSQHAEIQRHCLILACKICAKLSFVQSGKEGVIPQVHTQQYHMELKSQGRLHRQQDIQPWFWARTIPTGELSMASTSNH